MPDDEPQISYGLKEILGDINRKLDMALGLIHGKADAQKVDEIDARLRANEVAVEKILEQKQAKRQHREWLVPVLVSAALTVATVIQFFMH